MFYSAFDFLELEQSENTLVILPPKQNIYQGSIISGDKTINQIIKATVVLHDFIQFC